MTDDPTRDERDQARRDELTFILMREGVSLLVMCAVLVLMSPKVQIWMGEQRQRLTRRRSARQAREDKAVAELRLELRRDLPAVEHGLVDP